MAEGLMEPPKWGVHHAPHMRGWECFGVSGDIPPTLRPLGSGHDGKGKPGTEKWGPGEVKLGVAGVEIHTFADGAPGAYIYVIGTEKDDVERRWHVANELWVEVSARLWPTSR